MAQKTTRRNRADHWSFTGEETLNTGKSSGGEKIQVSNQMKKELPEPVIDSRCFWWGIGDADGH